MKVLSKSEWAILILIIVYSFIPTFGGLFRVFEFAGGPAIAPDNPRASETPFPIILHILSSFLFCILGAIQFLPRIRRQHPVAHQAFGRIVAVAGCLSAGSGLWMTHFYNFPIGLQGNFLYWARIILGFAMIGCIVGSIAAIRSRNIFQHSAFMLRAYAIGQGASTQTFTGIGWMIFSGAEATGPLRDAMMVSAWALNLLIAEVFVRALLAQKRTSSLKGLSNTPSRVGP